MATDEKVLEKIRKLLSLGGSSNEAEAMLAVNKAHALLREYNLSMDDIKEPVDVGRHDVIKGSRMLKWKKVLIYACAHANYCEVIETVGRGCHDFTLYGREHNVSGAMTLYDYLSGVVSRITKVQPPRIDKNDFSLGMAFRLKERLEEMLAREAAECTALVPVQSEAREAAIKDCNPKVTTSKIRTGLSSIYGARAADGVALNRQIRSEA